jgi:uncharacterized protein YkwD
MHPASTTATILPNRARLLGAALALAFTLGSLAAAAPVQATTRGDGLRDAANARRASVGVAPVVGTALLDDIADKRADRMRDADKLEHDMDYVRYRLNKADVCWTSFGEIIAYNYDNPYSYKETMTQWWKSKPHHEIMVSPSFNAAGGSWAARPTGMSAFPNKNYSVMVFATLCSSELTKSSLLQPKQEYSPDRPMIFVKGTHAAYKLSSTGQVLGSKTVTFGSRTGAESTGRARVDGKAYLKVTTGPLAGYWVRESPRHFVRGMTQKWTWSSPKKLSIAKGTYTGFKFDSLGRVTAKRKGTLAWNSGADASARAIINGRAYFLVRNGMWSGYWLRDTKYVNPIR